MAKISEAKIQKRLSELDDWKLDGDSITKVFKFRDFATAWDFMNQVAVLADKELHHHPEWTNVYNSVDISLTTHEAKGLTDKDFELARAIDEIAASFTD